MADSIGAFVLLICQCPPAPGSTTRLGFGASQMTEAARMNTTPIAIIIWLVASITAWLVIR